MASLNKCMLIGALGKDPEVRFTGTGQAVCSFSIATDESYKDKSGNKVEKSEWHNITMWGKLAEIAAEYLKKGKTVYIEGRLQTRKWQDKDGKDRYTTDITADKMQMLSGKGEYNTPKGASNQPDNGGGDLPADDDIPFNHG